MHTYTNYMYINLHWSMPMYTAPFQFAEAITGMNKRRGFHRCRRQKCRPNRQLGTAATPHTTAAHWKSRTNASCSQTLAPMFHSDYVRNVNGVRYSSCQKLLETDVNTA